MDVMELREKLHEYIETADEQHLSAIYTLVGNRTSSESDEDYVFDEETMKMLYERRERHRTGQSASYTVEESFNMIRQHKK